MKGFFSEENLQALEDSDCSKCKLHRGCKSPYMKETGKGEKEILVIAEAPGKTEDKKGEQLVGEAGQVLRDILEEFNLDLDRDCWKTNAVVCRPTDREGANRTPTKKEIICCNPRMVKTINKLKPKLILLLGGVALDAFYMNRFKGASGGINRWRGFVIPDQEQKVWVAPTYHPSYLLRMHNSILENIFRRDITNALRKLKRRVPDYTNKVEILDEFRANNMLQQHLDYSPDLFAFDYETTGIKPYKAGHEIVCTSVCFKEEEAYAFVLTNKLIRYWKQILKDKKIKKTAHNIKFEHLWSRNILEVEVESWEWCSMQAAHILDNREKITKLDFQAYAMFGQKDYSSHLDKFIKCDDGEGFNKIKEAPINEVLLYCGTDSFYQFRLAKKQMEELGWKKE